MTMLKISFRLLQITKGAVAGAALLILSIQSATAAHSESDMGNMEGMRPSPAAAEFSFGEPGKAAKVDRTISITMKTMSFEPASLTVASGETIRFVVSNKSEIDHDFTIGDVETQKAHRAEMAEAMEKAGKMEHGEDPNAMLVKAGQRRELIWKFTRVGRFEFACNIPGHYEAGMKGIIIVRGKADN